MNALHVTDALIAGITVNGGATVDDDGLPYNGPGFIVGGASVFAQYGSHHMRVIGKAGARATIAKHGRAYWLGLVNRKHWHGRQQSDLPRDLRAGSTLARWGS